MKVLMHMCCAPCAVYPVETLQSRGIEVDGLYYNPNIHPIEEFEKREENVEKLAKDKGLKIHYYPDFEQEAWEVFSEGDETRCNMCYTKRMKKLFEVAKEKGYKAVTTSLLVSPYQDHDLIKQLGETYSKKYDIEFYYEDFRVGYREGQKKAKAYGLYCQRYCGCIVSLKERISEIKNK